MWENRPVDASRIIDYQKAIVAVAGEALELFEGLGATEQDIADAIHYIDQWTNRTDRLFGYQDHESHRAELLAAMGV